MIQPNYIKEAFKRTVYHCMQGVKLGSNLGLANVKSSTTMP